MMINIQGWVDKQYGLGLEIHCCQGKKIEGVVLP